MSATRHIRLYLVRHGEVVRDVGDQLFGWTDAPLSPRGKAQSHRAARWLSTRRLAGVYTSDLARASYAGDLIAREQGLEAERAATLREIHMGEWEGKSLAAMDAANPGAVERLFLQPDQFRYPSGESFIEFRKRVSDTIQTILGDHTTGEIAVVTHGGVCRIVLGSALEMRPTAWLRLAQDHGCVNVVDWYGGEPVVRAINYTGEPFASDDLGEP